MHTPLLLGKVALHLFAPALILAAVPPPTVTGLVASSPGGFGSVYGSNLGVGEAEWSGSIGSDGMLPTTLAGVTVTIGGKAAPLSYVGPAQINFIMPDVGVPPGTKVDAVVTTQSGTASMTVPTTYWLRACSSSLPPDGRRHKFQVRPRP